MGDGSLSLLVSSLASYLSRKSRCIWNGVLSTTPTRAQETGLTMAPTLTLKPDSSSERSKVLKNRVSVASASLSRKSRPLLSSVEVSTSREVESPRHQLNDAPTRSFSPKSTPSDPA